jgi:S-adenosylmethionine hydrolase
VRLSKLRATWVDEGAGPAISGNVVHIDTFGNVVTTITESELDQAAEDRAARCRAAGDHATADQIAPEPPRVEVHGRRGVVTASLARTFADAARGEALAYVGSAGFLEVAIREGNLASTYGIVQEASVRVLGADAAQDGALG